MKSYDGFKASIIRICVEDFMTYHNCVVYAGPNINLFVGANGTGKSTIVCAICLGLAGKTKILHRASSIKEFIRHGQKKATIEIELYNPGGQNYVVRRIIKECGTGAISSWYLNGVSVQEKKIESLMESLNIQLDNLCQFLPQDRVQEFAKMDNATLLISTEKAIGNDFLANKHKQLIIVKDEVKQLEKSLTMNSGEIQRQKHRMQSVEWEFNQYQEKKNLKLKIQELNGKKAWKFAIEALESYNSTKAELDEAIKQKKADETYLASFEHFINGSLSPYRHKMIEARSCNETQITVIKKKYEDDADKIEMTISEHLADYQAKLASEEERVDRYEKCQDKLRKLENDFKEKIGNLNEDQIKNERIELEEEHTRIQYEIIQMKSLEDIDKEEIKMIKERIEAKEREMKCLTDKRKSRLKYLERTNKDLYQAVEFFSKEENIKSFKGKIYEPMILHVFVNDLKYGKIAETHIGNSNLNAYFVEDIDDYLVMIKITNEKKWRFAIVHHSFDSDFSKPNSTIPKGILEKYHFRKLLIDIIEAPDYYMSFLVQNYKLQNVPIGGDETEKAAADIMNNSGIRHFYTDNYSYIIKESLYSKEKGLSSSIVRPASVFTEQINANEIAKLEENKINYQKQVEAIEKQIQSRYPDKGEKEKLRDEVKGKLKRNLEKVNEIKHLEGNIQGARRKLAVIKGEELNISKIKRDSQQRIYHMRIGQFDSLDVCTGDTNISDNSFNLVILKRQVFVLENAFNKKADVFETAKTNYAKYNSKITKLASQVNELSAKAEKLKQEAKNKSQMSVPPNDIPSLEEVEKSINLLSVKLKFIPETDENISNIYEEKLKKIEGISKTKEEIEIELSKKKKELDHIKNEWLGPLKELILRINDNFSSYFASMKCAGEVALDVGQDPDDFSKYGIKILVKFRASERLTELRSWKQSGGERSISTALYVLALQELTTVPFRVIDEINQGMDQKNEAKFFNLLCNLAKGPNTPQYFIFTPKMLPEVDYPDNVSFKFIFNGPVVDSQMQWNFNEKEKKEKKKRQA